jgi:hypothetical protein
MNIEEKMRILAKFFTDVRLQDDIHLNRLFELRDYWNDIYNENRIRLSFEAARILANECVIAKVLSYDYL